MGGTVYNLSDEQKEMNEWTRRSRNEGICGIVKCFNSQPLSVKDALTTTVQNIFPSTLIYYLRDTLALNTLLQMMV